MSKKLIDDIVNLTLHRLANNNLASEKLHRTKNDYSDADILISSDTAMHLSNMFPELFYNDEILNAARVELDKKLDRASSSMEKDANRRINRIKNTLHMKDGEGVFVHGIRIGEFDRKTGKYKNLLNNEELIDLMKNYVNATGSAKVVAPAYLVGTNQLINAETKSFGRSVIQGNSVNLPKGSIINPDGTVTSHIFNHEPIGAELGTTSGIDSEDKIKSLLNDIFYKKSVHDSLPKTQDGLKTTWDVCVEPYRSNRYSGIGIITSDSNIVGQIKGDINQLKKKEKFPEFRITPMFHENGTMTTGYIKGVPFYIVDNNSPTVEELKLIKKLKEEFPNIMPIKDKDLEIINKYVPNNDLRSLRNLSPNQYRNKLNKMIRESYKRTEKSDLLQELLKILNGKLNN